jgi:phage portal protein BeeE
LPAVDYSAHDIIYRPRNVRAHRVYGYSPVQQVLMTINIALRRQLWQLDHFSEGSIPDALIGVPTSWTPDQIKQFQDYWDTEFAGDLAKRRRAKFVPGEATAKVVQTKEPSHKTISTNGSPASSATRLRMIRKSGSQFSEKIMRH